MDNIYSNSSNTAIVSAGQEFGSQRSTTSSSRTGPTWSLPAPTSRTSAGTSGPSSAIPMFVDAADGNFQLMAGSAAIDAARSEIGPLTAGDAIYPTVTQVLTGTTGGIRTNPGTLTPPATPGRSTTQGGS